MYWLTLRFKNILLQSSSRQHLPSEVFWFIWGFAVGWELHLFPVCPHLIFLLLIGICHIPSLCCTRSVWIWSCIPLGTYFCGNDRKPGTDCCCSFPWLVDKWQRAGVFWDLVSFQFTEGLIQNLWRQQKAFVFGLGPKELPISVEKQCCTLQMKRSVTISNRVQQHLDWNNFVFSSFKNEIFPFENA